MTTGVLLHELTLYWKGPLSAVNPPEAEFAETTFVSGRYDEEARVYVGETSVSEVWIAIEVTETIGLALELTKRQRERVLLFDEGYMTKGRYGLPPEHVHAFSRVLFRFRRAELCGPSSPTSDRSTASPSASTATSSPKTS